MIDLPVCTTLTLQRQGLALLVTLNRPRQRNAMTLAMVQELEAVFTAVDAEPAIRAVVLRGGGGHFCAGADIGDLAAARGQASFAATLAASSAASQPVEDDPFYQLNRAFGRLLTRVDRAPAVVIAVLEGAVLGGGLGLACVSDLALCVPEARLGLPETGLGIPPAQIAPFVVKRIGLTAARRLALLALRFDGAEAVRLGIAHELVEPDQIDARLEAMLAQIRGRAPQANRVTKALLHQVSERPLEPLLDHAAAEFVRAVRGVEGQEGSLAFIQKRQPGWAEDQS